MFVKKIFSAGFAIIFLPFLWNWQGAGFSQDFHLSQFDAFPQFLNPAMTGIFEGDYRVNIHFRTQWGSIAANPFTTGGAGFDMPYKKIKAGGYILNNRAGAGNYNVLNAVGSAAFDRVAKASYHHVAVGLQAGIIHKSVNLNNLFFGSQYTPANGGSFNNTLPSGEIFANPSIVLPELNAGALYYYANTGSRINPFLGASVFHLIQPKETFFAIKNELPMRFLGHGGVKINISTRLQLLAHFLFMQQTNDKEIVSGAIITYYLKNQDVYLFCGSNYRNKDAAVIQAGLSYRNFTYRFSYDVNTSGLTTISQGRGGFEMSLVYIYRKPPVSPVAGCPRI